MTLLLALGACIAAIAVDKLFPIPECDVPPIKGLFQIGLYVLEKTIVFSP